MRRPDIIMLALPRWDGNYASTSYAIASELAKTHRVFYVDNPFTWKDFLTRFKTRQVRRRLWALLFGVGANWRDRTMSENLTIITPRLVIPANFLSDGIMYRFLAGVNNRIVSSAINGTMRRAGVDHYLYINSFNPFYHVSLKKRSPGTFVYQCVDDIGQHAYVSKHGPRLEAKMIEAADIVLVTSRELLRLKQYAGPKVFYLPNAVNAGVFENIAAAGRPADIPEGFEGVIGYVGNIDPRLDYTLLSKIARRYPAYLLLIVGPKNFDEYKSYDLEDASNVCFVGSKDYKDLPGYMGTFDCAIIPFKCNAATSSIYPLKVNEYLASGKPVVSTSFSDDIRSFADVISVATDHETFLRMIAEEIGSDSASKRARRYEVAKQNTWQARVSAFWEIMKTHGEE